MAGTWLSGTCTCTTGQVDKQKHWSKNSTQHRKGSGQLFSLALVEQNTAVTVAATSGSHMQYMFVFGRLKAKMSTRKPPSALPAGLGSDVLDNGKT